MDIVLDPLPIKQRIVYSQNMGPKLGLSSTKPRAVFLRSFWAIATVTTAGVASTHDQCPVNITVGTKSTDTVADVLS